ncbi:hypothetical protein [Streptomyces mirabilis]|uniref:hypothetical protein n=1 Tax=Streptomyces mirabilis TaxID=68239 RepID=UPI0036E796A4
MALHPKPAEGSWTEHYPDLGTGAVSYEDCVSPAFCEVEREAVFGHPFDRLTERYDFRAERKTVGV